MSTTLLLADDSPTIAKILQMALANEAYKIRAVLTAEEALSELKNNTPYFFLCDLNLPGKNGYEFAKLIRGDSKLRDIRIVLLASAFEPVDEAEFATCGADGLVKKPFDPAELRTKLRQIMEAPPKFPGNARVSGSLSGYMVQDPQDSTRTNLTIGGISTAGLTDTNPSLVAPPKDDASLLLQTNSSEPAAGDADSILAGLVEPSAGPPAFVIPTAPAGSIPDDNRPEPTVTLDLSEAGLGGVNNSMDPSAMSFDTPPGGTQIIELGTHTMTVGQADFPPPMKAAEEPPPPPAPASSVADEPLSANAQALAAFFDAEIHTNAGQREANTAPGDEVPSADAFDASLDSIDWNTPAPAAPDLKDWSANKAPAEKPSAPPPKAPAKPVDKPVAAKPAAPAPAPAPRAEDKPPPFSRPAAPAPKAEAPRAAAPAAAPSPAPAPKEEPARPQIRGGSGGPGHLMFDTGGSTFRFSEDYVHRITKSFTGEPNETVPESHPAAAAMFPQASDDRGPPPSGAGGGAWNEQEVAKIEQIVREEVQMVVREVAEKIAWEVIPELAENLIKKELERVLKEMGQ